MHFDSLKEVPQIILVHVSTSSGGPRTFVEPGRTLQQTMSSSKYASPVVYFQKRYYADLQ
jgi:hypothetical protein